MSALDALIDHWRIFNQEAVPMLHRRDKPFMANGLEDVHTDISPYPYVGDLRGADVWLLMLNSKLGANDKTEEGQEPYRSLFNRNFRQDISDQEYPLLSVDPALQHTGTYQYYNHTRGLQGLILGLANAASVTEAEARRMIGRQVAILELLPYRSKSFPSGLNQLPSVNLARAAAREASASKLLVVPWGINRWALQPGPKVVHRSARTFSFAPGGVSGYGEAIIRRLVHG